MAARKYNNRRAFTLVEVLVAALAAVILIVGISAMLFYGQRGYNTMYRRVNSEVVRNAYEARMVFDAVVRKSTSDRCDIRWMRLRRDFHRCHRRPASTNVHPRHSYLPPLPIPLTRLCSRRRVRRRPGTHKAAQTGGRRGTGTTPSIRFRPSLRYPRGSVRRFSHPYQ